jgi:hypothetical protein
MTQAGESMTDSKDRTVDDTIKQMTSIDKFITCLMMANGICFRGQPKNYKREQDIRKMCPPKARQLFNLNNLKRLGVVYAIPKQARLIALQGFGIKVAVRLYETGEAKKVYDMYEGEFIPL